MAQFHMTGSNVITEETAIATQCDMLVDS